MLFDLQGKNRKLYKTIYITLSVLIILGLLIGIGSGFGGASISDLFTNSAGGGNPLEKQVGKYQKQLRQDPKNDKIMLSLVKAQYAVASSGDNYNQQTGAFTDKATDALNTVTGSWERYLKLNPKKPDPGVAALMVNAYEGLAQGAEQQAQTAYLKSAVRAEQVVIEARPVAASYLQLAALAYAAGENSLGDQAGKKALALAKPSEKKAAKAQLKQIKQQAAQQSAAAATSTTATPTPQAATPTPQSTTTSK